MLSLGVFGIFIIYSWVIRERQPEINPMTATAQNTYLSNANRGRVGTLKETTASKYKNGNYTGQAYNAFYGNIQVSTTVADGKITDVQFLQYPDTHETSVYINQQAMPFLRQEAVKAQSSNVNMISGATFTSQAFKQSLADTLLQAHA